ncbi:MAG: ChaN family lipoprotein [Cyanosarcina radialis HA8281-LM2]|jgi:uncharacterized iron-regulated protein|nr:ChaN family lipoprotein [Cyanosarcina radialis HA8281-LM2]
MLFFQIGQLCALSLGIVLLCSSSVGVQSLPNSAPLAERENIASVERSQILSELVKADVVYLGEIHDRAEDHQAQLEIIQHLHRRRGRVAIAMEMFQRPYQDSLNRYLAGEITEEQLLEETEYQKRWGFPWEYYAPILRYAKENRLPVLALNTPTEVSRQVTRGGLESLTPDQRRFIPPDNEIDTDNAEYRKIVLEAFKQHQAGSHGSSPNLERFFLVQVLWDETMAEAIANFIKTQPDYQVVVLAGSGHIIYGYGIPSRVARRLSDRKLLQRSVLLSPNSDTFDRDGKVADFLWNYK